MAWDCWEHRVKHVLWIYGTSTLMTHWGLNKMADTLQTIFSNAFSSMKISVIGFLFTHRSMLFIVHFTMKHSLTQWGRATHICANKITIIGPDNGLSPGRRQAIIWTIAGILLIGPFGTNFSKILIGIQTFSFKKMHLKMASAKWRPFVSASMC